MIIDYPTALYRDVLPGIGDTGNTTWLISSTNPPRSTVPLQRIPDAELLRKREPSPITQRQHRQAVGDLVFSLTAAQQSISGSSTTQFEVGQVLEFTTETIKAVNPALVPEGIEIQHNLNVLDLNALGLTDAEISELTQESEDAKQTMEDQIAELSVASANAEVSINENQKRINEAIKAKDAADVVGNVPISQKLAAKITALTAERNALIDTLNALNAEVGQKFDELLKVVPLVR
ncbi:MAG: hypothetical protein Q8K86_08285 [Candidatus Nanopelagicaceae bacterium]|nr:hypothetical protein [Candidatus Nanopelagicaceae bacterium]